MSNGDGMTRRVINARSATAQRISHIEMEEGLLELIATDVRTFGLVASQQEWEYVTEVLTTVKATSAHDVEAMRKASKRHIVAMEEGTLGRGRLLRAGIARQPPFQRMDAILAYFHTRAADIYKRMTIIEAIRRRMKKPLVESDRAKLAEARAELLALVVTGEIIEAAVYSPGVEPDSS